MVKKQPNPAKDVLLDALQQITTKAEVHGDTKPSFELIAEMWSAYIKHSHRLRPEEWVSARDVAQLMALLKIARSCYVSKKEHYVDASGYIALAPLVEGPPDEEEEE